MAWTALVKLEKLASTDDLIIFWMSKVKVAAGCWGNEGIRVDAGA